MKGPAAADILIVVDVLLWTGLWMDLLVLGWKVMIVWFK